MRYRVPIIVLERSSVLSLSAGADGGHELVGAEECVDGYSLSREVSQFAWMRCSKFSQVAAHVNTSHVFFIEVEVIIVEVEIVVAIIVIIVLSKDFSSCLDPAPESESTQCEADDEREQRQGRQTQVQLRDATSRGMSAGLYLYCT